MPVVQSRPFHCPVGNVETQRADQMEAGAGSGAGAGDVSAVLRDFRLHQNDIYHSLASFLQTAAFDTKGERFPLSRRKYATFRPFAVDLAYCNANKREIQLVYCTLGEFFSKI
jgi:hypothetical protein